MNATSVIAREEKTGQVILLVSSALATLLVIAGLVYAGGTGGRDQATLAAAGCEPGLSSFAQACTTQPMLASQYKELSAPATQQLNVERDAYIASEGRDLAVAEAALTAEATTERAFDTSLAGVAFPPAIAGAAQAVIRDNQALAKLTAEQARSATLIQMRSLDPRAAAAAARVQTEMNLVLKAVDTPIRAS